MMFGKRKKQKKLVWFSCDPKLSGRVDVLFGVPIGVLFTLRCLEFGEWTNFGTMLSFVYLAVIIFGGLYRWLFRCGAVERTVVIGGFAQRAGVDAVSAALPRCVGLRRLLAV